MSFKKTELGIIPEEWGIEVIDNIKADEKNAIAMGPFGSNIKKENFVASGIPVLRGNNLKKHILCEDEFIYLTEEKAQKLKASEVKRGDIVITHRGTLGQVSFVPFNSKYDRYIVSQSGMKLTCNQKKVDPMFINYFLNSRIGQYLLLRNKSQVGVPSIASPTTSLKKIPVPVPKLEEQKSIANILSTLDEKIETNNQINKKLEEMAQAIFKQWFVDFEFPNENREPYKSSGGEMVESEMGMIPLGWEFVEISEICEIQNGFAFKAPEYVDNGIKVMRTLNIGNNGYFENSNIVYLPDSYDDEKYTKYLLKRFDCALVMVGAGIGKIGIVLENTENSLQNQNMWRFRTKKQNIPQLYLNYMVREAQRISQNWATGSARDFYRKDSFAKIKVLVPTYPILEKFNAVIQAAFDRISNLTLENEKITKIRDIILPKLMSGEIRIPTDSTEN